MFDCFIVEDLKLSKHDTQPRTIPPHQPMIYVNILVIVYVKVWHVQRALPSLKVACFLLVLNALWHWLVGFLSQ